MSINIISSEYQTKQWRKDQDWYINGKKNECELQERKQFENIILQPLPKSSKRLFMINNSIVERVRNPLQIDYGFEYTEDFDGEFKKDDILYLVNFKFTCDQGGAQTRTLREVYHFIKSQKCFLRLNHPNYKICFINILDGDTQYRHRKQYSHLLESRIFIGDMKEFLEWWNNRIEN